MIRALRNSHSRATATCLLASLILAASCASAQTLPGLWGSVHYRVQLAVSGTTVSGTFTSLEDPKAPPGKITGQVLPGGQAFTATWTPAAGPEAGGFSTSLKLAGKDSLLTGYRWTEETLPTSFALHRAVNGQLVQLLDPAEQQVTGGTDAGTGTGATTPTGEPSATLVMCRRLQDGQPVDPGATVFIAPDKTAGPEADSVVAVVTYSGMAQGTTWECNWKRDGKWVIRHPHVVTGPDDKYATMRWNPQKLEVTPGNYVVTIDYNGKELARQEFKIVAAGEAERPPDDMLSFDTPAASSLLAKQYDRNSFQIQVEAMWLKPGFILGTVGINAAAVGSFCVMVDDRGILRLQVYAPQHKSPAKTANGWHVVPAKAPMPAGTLCELTVSRDPQRWQLRIVADGHPQQDLSVALPVPASGEPVYLGDFPGDNNWPGSNTGFTGKVRILDFVGKQQ